MEGGTRVSLAFDEDVVLAKASNVRKTVAAIRSLDGPELGAPGA